MIPSGAFDLNLKSQPDFFKFCPCGLEIAENCWKLFEFTLFFKQFARYPSLYVLGAFPAWLKVLSRNFGAVLLKKPKFARDSVPLKFRFQIFTLLGANNSQQFLNSRISFSGAYLPLSK